MARASVALLHRDAVEHRTCPPILFSVCGSVAARLVLALKRADG